jgi:hypothetical protein
MEASPTKEQLRIASPPVTGPCYYEVGTPSKEELIFYRLLFEDNLPQSRSIDRGPFLESSWAAPEHHMNRKTVRTRIRPAAWVMRFLINNLHIATWWIDLNMRVQPQCSLFDIRKWKLVTKSALILLNLAGVNQEKPPLSFSRLRFVLASVFFTSWWRSLQRKSNTREHFYLNKAATLSRM